MSRVVIDFPPSGRCPACGGPWICADLDDRYAPEYRCLHCGRPPVARPHSEPDRWEAGRLTRLGRKTVRP